MIEMLCGVVGAAVVLISFYAGFRFGSKSAVVPTKELTTEEKQAIAKEREMLIREQDAFSRLMGYNTAVAYDTAAKGEITNE